MDFRDSISWQRWNDAGYGGRWSKGHWIDPEDGGRTLCGWSIPDLRDGLIDIEGGKSVEGFCNKCRKIEERGVDEGYDEEGRSH